MISSARNALASPTPALTSRLAPAVSTFNCQLPEGRLPLGQGPPETHFNLPSKQSSPGPRPPSPGPLGHAVRLRIPACLGVEVAADPDLPVVLGVKVRASERLALFVRCRRSPHRRQYSLTDSSASSRPRAAAPEEVASNAR